MRSKTTKHDDMQIKCDRVHPVLALRSKNKQETITNRPIKKAARQSHAAFLQSVQFRVSVTPLEPQILSLVSASSTQSLRTILRLTHIPLPSKAVGS